MATRRPVQRGLCRALGGPLQADAGPDGNSLDIFLEQFLTGFMRPLDMGDQVELCMRLHFREMLDPTGLWQQELDSEIKPLHSTLIRLLCQAVARPRPTTTSTAWRWPSRPLPLQYYAHRDLIQQMAPQLLNDPECLQATTRRLIDFAHHLIAGETRRRQTPAGDAP